LWHAPPHAAYTDSNGVRQTFAPQFVKRVKHHRGGRNRLEYRAGVATVPVGSGISDVSIRAWNIKFVGDVGQWQ
jgi:hypothetical protein